MTSKERVTAALGREPVDRVPVFMWFHPQTARQLAQRLEIPVTHVGDADFYRIFCAGTIVRARSEDWQAAVVCEDGDSRKCLPQRDQRGRHAFH